MTHALAFWDRLVGFIDLDIKDCWFRSPCSLHLGWDPNISSLDEAARRKRFIRSGFHRMLIRVKIVELDLKGGRHCTEDKRLVLKLSI